MINWPKPKNVRELIWFLRLTKYYRHFIIGYGNIARSLTDLLKKNAFHWSDTVDKSFPQLKDAMTKASVLALSNFSFPFVKECDSFRVGVGAVLM